MAIHPAPEQVATSWSGSEEGRELLRSLPAVLADLRRRFGLRTVGAPWPGGWVGYVAPADLLDGTPVVLKLSLSDDEHRHEADALAVWNGDGAARLLDRVTEPNAMVIERLEPGTALLDHPDGDEAVVIACGVLRRLQRPLPHPLPFATVTALAARYATWIPEAYERYGRPFDPGLATEAAALSAAYAAEPDGPPHLVNRDFHLGNVLAATREPWLAIDPKPLAGERAFDTGHLLRDLTSPTPTPGELRDLVGRLAELLDLAPDRVCGWALIRSVENVLWLKDDALARPDWIAWDVALAAALARLRA